MKRTMASLLAILVLINLCACSEIANSPTPTHEDNTVTSTSQSESESDINNICGVWINYDGFFHEYSDGDYLDYDKDQIVVLTVITEDGYLFTQNFGINFMLPDLTDWMTLCNNYNAASLLTLINNLYDESFDDIDEAYQDGSIYKYNIIDSNTIISVDCDGDIYDIYQIDAQGKLNDYWYIGPDDPIDLDIDSNYFYMSFEKCYYTSTLGYFVGNWNIHEITHSGVRTKELDYMYSLQDNLTYISSRSGSDTWSYMNCKLNLGGFEVTPFVLSGDKFIMIYGGIADLMGMGVDWYYNTCMIFERAD